MVAPGADGNPIVNVTGYVREDEQRYPSAERFGDALSSIECPSGQIAFTFSSQDTFTSAQDKWGWVNTGDRSVIIVLEAGTCNNEKRQPYLAQSVDYKAGSRRATFEAAVSNWEESVKSYKIVADTQGIMSQTTDASLNRRQSISEEASIDMNSDFSGNIFSAPDVANSSLTFDLNCKSCSTSGRLDFRFEATADILGAIGDFFGGQDGDNFRASASVRPTGVGANVELGFVLGGELTQALSFNPSLPPIILPGGFSNPIITVGPNLVVSYLAELSAVSAQAELSIGTKITIDDTAEAKISIGDGDNTFNGWTPRFERVGPDASASVSVSARTGPQISVELDVSPVERPGSWTGSFCATACSLHVRRSVSHLLPPRARKK